MSNWQEQAIKALEDSLYPVPQGHTVKMSKEQVHELIAQSHGLSFEDRVAKSGVSREEVENLLDCPKMFELLGRSLPSDKQQMPSVR